MAKKKILVLFPGKRYSCDLPLLHFADCVYQDKGYDVLRLVYPDLVFEGKPGKEIYAAVQKSVLAQAAEAKIDTYDEAVFISKSMGTVCAGWLEGQVKVPVRHIYLTPLAETLPYMQGRKNIVAVVQGSADKWFDHETLEKFCEKEGLRFLTFPGVGHRLEKKGDIMESIENFRTVAALYEEDAGK